MAVDEAILEAVGRGDSRATLRLYSWEPPCLSLGYAQPIGDVDLPRLQQNGWDLVRRPTGGRAILHTDELTYAVIGPETDPRLKGGILPSYRRLARALLHALHQLGVPARAEGPGETPASKQDPGPICFEVPSPYEITAGGRKLIGSAQSRRKGCVLQHGSLPLMGDLTRITRVLQFSTEDERRQAARTLLERATTVEAVLAKPVAWERAAQAFIDGFEAALAISLAVEELRAEERGQAETLVREKYDHPAWTQRG